MDMVNIIKPLWIRSFQSIFPKIITSSKVRGIHLISKFYFSIIIKTTMVSCLQVSQKACLLMIFFFRLFHLLSLQLFHLYLNLTLVYAFYCNLYPRRQEVDQTFITTSQSLIDFVNLIINKRLKYVRFYNIFAHLEMILVTFPRSNQFLFQWINLRFYWEAPRGLILGNEKKEAVAKICLTF